MLETCRVIAKFAGKLEQILKKSSRRESERDIVELIIADIKKLYIPRKQRICYYPTHYRNEVDISQMGSEELGEYRTSTDKLYEKSKQNYYATECAVSF